MKKKVNAKLLKKVVFVAEYYENMSSQHAVQYWTGTGYSMARHCGMPVFGQIWPKIGKYFSGCPSLARLW